MRALRLPNGSLLIPAEAEPAEDSEAGYRGEKVYGLLLMRGNTCTEPSMSSSAS